MTRRFNLVDARTENELSSRAREHRAGGPVFDAAQARLRTGHSAAQRGEAERRRSHATRCLLRPAREAVDNPGGRRMTSGPPRKQQWAGRSTAALLLPPRCERERPGLGATALVPAPARHRAIARASASPRLGGSSRSPGRQQAAAGVKAEESIASAICDALGENRTRGCRRQQSAASPDERQRPWPSACRLGAGQQARR